MEQRNVIIQIPVKEHTVDYNRLIEYLNKTYCRKYSISQQTETNPLVSSCLGCAFYEECYTRITRDVPPDYSCYTKPK